MAEAQKLNEQTTSDSQIIISAHRKLTFIKAGGDYDGPAGGITFPLSATPDQVSRALARFNEVVTELDRRLAVEKQESIKRAGATQLTRPTAAATSTPAPSQQAPAGDPYGSLGWQPGKTKTGKTYGYRMVTSDQPQQATELYNLLKASPKSQAFFGSVEYRLTTAKFDRPPKYRAGTEFLQRWTN